jgi:hypothetical protein
MIVIDSLVSYSKFERLKLKKGYFSLWILEKLGLKCIGIRVFNAYILNVHNAPGFHFQIM